MNDDSAVLAGRTALVTGGGSGIGRAIAAALAERGMDVLVTGRREHALRHTAALGSGVRHHAADVTRPVDVTAAVRAATERHGRLDLLVNNAAVGRPASLADLDADDIRLQWETNVVGPMLLAREALPYLTEHGGAIVNVSSTFGAKPAPRIAVYGATKAALESLTRSWALELAPLGVRVNAVAPGPTESDALTNMGLSDTEAEQVRARERSTIPLGRRGEPEEVAYWVTALADNRSGWVTGQVIGVDGGYQLA